jgi:DNA-binding GntR family transcriptional regulator
MILEALRDADAERLAVLCREHMRSAGKRLVAILKANQDDAEGVTDQGPETDKALA